MDPRDLIWREGPVAFAFLAAAGFTGPEQTDYGIAYRRDGLRITLKFFGPREPEISTTISFTPVGATSRPVWASLCCLYVACRLGPLQDVPGNAPNPKTAARRIGQHAQALRLVLPHLLDDEVVVLLRRCQQRLLPIPPEASDPGRVDDGVNGVPRQRAVDTVTPKIEGVDMPQSDRYVPLWHVDRADVP